MVRKAILLLLITVLFLGLFAAPVVGQRSFHFPRLEIEATVKPDGSLHVLEHRTADFRGTYRGLYQWIPVDSPVEITDIQVWEGGTPYTLNPGEDIGPPGTFFLRDEGHQVYIDWSFEATNQVRTFTLEYRVLNAVQIHRDVAELYYQFVGDEWEVPVDDVVVQLQLPSGAEQEELRAWGHGPLHGEVEIIDAETVRWHIAPLPARQMLEGRVTFPPSLTPAGDHRTDREALPAILAEEQRWADEANRERMRFQADRYLGILVALAGLIAVLLLWRTYGKEFRPSFDGDYYRELPAEYTPAELGVLWRFGSPSAEDLSATLLDLARKGWIRMEEYAREYRHLLRRREETDVRLIRQESGDGTLARHEKDLLIFLFSEVSEDKNMVTIHEISTFAKRHARRFARFWREWVADLTGRGDALEFFDRTTRRVQILEIVLGGLLFPVGFFLFVSQMFVTGIGALIAGLALVIGGAVLRRRSRQGLEDFTRWRAFRRFLQHFSQMDRQQVPALIIWEHYLVYAVTLGVAKEVLKQLEVVFPNLQEGNYRFGGAWYVSTMGYSSLGTMSTQLDSLNQSVTTAVKTATTPSSSGAGGGGGFSGGGGGGFGGGGGGAR